MSTDDYVVDPLRDLEVRAYAKTLRRHLGWSDEARVDPLAAETWTEIWTVRGKKPFKLEIVSDDELPDDSGLTTYDGSRIIVKIPRRIRYEAYMGVGYARFTIAHELAHACLHFDKLKQGAVMPRRQAGNANLAWIPKYKSAEHQAMVFAAALLINERLARELESPEEISEQAGVSLAAARIVFEQVQEKMDRSIVANQIRELAKRISPEPATFKAPAFLNEACSCCGLQKLFPVGHKYMCQACDAVYDRFQDGDPVQ
jgi:hypothetical protein